tara:strand:- start:1303 stop:2562 length:1260 start_codon:yes stop_codon:yes gene_type:complete
MINVNYLADNRVKYLPLFSVFIAMSLYCIDVLLRVCPGVLSSQLITHYKINQTAFSNLSAAYFYIYAPMQLPVGILMDRYGPRKLLSVSSLACCLGTILFSLTHTYWIAFIGRLLIGFGASFAFVGIMKLATLVLPPNRFAVISGSTMALGMIGAMVGDQILKHFLLNGQWQGFMFKISGILLILGLVIHLTAPTLNHNDDEHSRYTMGQIMRDALGLVRQREIWNAALIGCLMFTPLTWFAEYLGKTYLAMSMNISFSSATNLNGLIFVGWAIGGLVVTSFSDYIRSRRLPIILGALVSFALSLLILYQTGIRYEIMALIMVVFGIANSVQVLAFPIAKEITKPHLQATAMCFINMICMFSGNLQVFLGYSLDMVHHFSSHSHDVLQLSDYQIVFSLLPIALLLTSVIAYNMRESFSD